jgi:hypothetical protein
MSPHRALRWMEDCWGRCRFDDSSIEPAHFVRNWPHGNRSRTRQPARATEELKPASLRSQQAVGSRSRTRQQARGCEQQKKVMLLFEPCCRNCRPVAGRPVADRPVASGAKPSHSENPVVDTVDLLPRGQLPPGQLRAERSRSISECRRQKNGCAAHAAQPLSSHSVGQVPDHINQRV